jgi:hypothetical protein
MSSRPKLCGSRPVLWLDLPIKPLAAQSAGINPEYRSIHHFVLVLVVVLVLDGLR